MGLPPLRRAVVLESRGDGRQHFAGVPDSRRRHPPQRARDGPFDRAGRPARQRPGPVADPQPESRPDGLLPAIAGVTYADGGQERYFTPFATEPRGGARPASGDPPIGRAAGGAVVDALEDDEACRALATAMLDQRPLVMRHGVVRATAYGPAVGVRGLRIIRSAGEQSNSCIRFDDRYVLKVFRRLEPGPHPELEIARFLSARGFEGIPRLVASLECERPGEEPMALALLQAYVASQGTGWDLAVDDVRRCMLRDALSARVTDAIAFLAAAARLGQRTAELHVALAADDRDPAFAPETLTAADAEAMTARMHREAARALTLLAERLSSLSGSARDHAYAVLDARPLLTARIDTFANAPASSTRTRVHGDYHLGQVLAVGKDFVIIDFEGEPARSIAVRRAKQSPLKDAAGMLRSFSYAAHATALEAAAIRPDVVGRLEPRARLWERAVSAAFLKRYRRTMAGTGLVPIDDQGFGQWLDAFLLR